MCWHQKWLKLLLLVCVVIPGVADQEAVLVDQALHPVRQHWSLVLAVRDAARFVVYVTSFVWLLFCHSSPLQRNVYAMASHPSICLATVSVKLRNIPVNIFQHIVALLFTFLPCNIMLMWYILWLHVRRSVCLSQAHIVPKYLNIWSHKQRGTI